MAELVSDPYFKNKIRVFKDRFHAGELLAKKLEDYKDKMDVYVLAIPAGGVQVASVVSETLKLPLDLAITRKIHVPWNKEAGFGAVSWDGLIFLNEPLLNSLNLTREEVDRCIAEEKAVIRRRMTLFRGNRPFPKLREKTVIIVDDGLASGFSMLTTVKALQRQKSKEIVVAVPTAPLSAIELLRPHADKIVCLNIRTGSFFAVADAYQAWYDLEDQDVLDLLN